MIPVASGVLPDGGEGGRRIDLARCCGPGWFEFIELKVGGNCNTPLRAAIELLGYALIYRFSRSYARELGLRKLRWAAEKNKSCRSGRRSVVQASGAFGASSEALRGFRGSEDFCWARSTSNVTRAEQSR
jgi:hypothetical protein